MDIGFRALEDTIVFSFSGVEARQAAILMEQVLRESMQEGKSVPVFSKNFFQELSVVESGIVIEFRSKNIFFGLRLVESIFNHPECRIS